MFDGVIKPLSKTELRILPILGVIASLFLVIFAGTRIGVGYDFEQYQIIFSDMDYEGRENYGVEAGFNYFVTFLSPLGFKSIFLICAILSVGIKCKLLIRYSAFPFVALALYFNQDFLARDMGNIRQGIAVAIGLYIFLKGQFWSSARVIAAVLIAMLFHYTAIVLTPFLFLRRLRIDNKTIVMIVLLCLVIGQLISSEVVVGILGHIDNDYVLKKLNDYAAQEDYSSELGLTLGLFLRIFIFFLYITYFGNSNSTSFNNTLKNLVLFGLCLFLLFNSFEIIAVRLALYYRILDLIVLTQLLTVPKIGVERFICYCAIAAYSFQGLFRELNRHGVYFDYASWFL